MNDYFSLLLFEQFHLNSNYINSALKVLRNKWNPRFAIYKLIGVFFFSVSFSDMNW